MSATVKLEGLDDLLAELLKLPETLKAEAAQIVLEAAESCKREVQAAYPTGPTGNLKRGVTMNVDSNSRFGVAARVKSNAKHVHIFENGTQQRHTNSGANRGRMPRAPESERMIPIVIRARRRMVQQLIEMVQKHGLEVTSS
jgi:hypothetical protein